MAIFETKSNKGKKISYNDNGFYFLVIIIVTTIISYF